MQTSIWSSKYFHIEDLLCEGTPIYRGVPDIWILLCRERYTNVTIAQAHTIPKGLRPLLPRQAFCADRVLAFGVIMRSVTTECSLWRVTRSRGKARLEAAKPGQRRRG